MKDWSDKIDNGNYINGHVSPSELQSNFNEKKNVVLTTMPLKETDNKQMVNSINTLTQTLNYTDIGVVNEVKLKRIITMKNVETYSDGMTLFFIPAFNNTGDVTLSVAGLPPKPTAVRGVELPCCFLLTTAIYMAVFDKVEDKFNIYLIAVRDGKVTHFNIDGDASKILQVIDGVASKDVINVQQLSTYAEKTDVVDNLTSTSTTKALSANQGRILGEYINSNIVDSNDVNLDSIQEIVNYIKDNRDALEHLHISNIVSMEDALTKMPSVNHNHDDRYYKKIEVDTAIGGKAFKGGNSCVMFKVADAVDDKDAMNVRMVNQLNAIDVWDYVKTTNPTFNINPTIDNAKWKNTTTGEIFICADRTTDKNIWKGTNGTVSQPPVDVTHVVDIFNDGSGIALYEFEGNVNDTGGLYNATVAGSTSYDIHSPFGDKSIHVNNDGHFKVNTQGIEVKTISLWVSIGVTSATYNTIMDNRFNDNLDKSIVRTEKANDILVFNGVDKLKVDDVIVNSGDAEHIIGSGWHHLLVELTKKETLFGFGGPADNYVDQYCLNGNIDQMRLFNRALTASEITTLYNEPPSGS